MSTFSTSSESTSATSFVAASTSTSTSTPPTSMSTSAPGNLVGIAADQGNHTLKVSDPHLSTTTMGDLSTNTAIDAHDVLASTAPLYPWQIGQMPSLHRRSSCATLDTLSAPFRHQSHGVLGDSINSANPMHFSLCSTSWQASQWEHSGGLPPPRPVSAPAFSTSLLAESDALDNGPSWLNPIVTSDAQYSNSHGYDQAAGIEDLNNAAVPDLSMPPMTTSIPAVSTIPAFPSLTTTTTSFVDNTGIASWFGSGSWSLENSGGVTAVPLGSEDMQLDDLMFQPHRLLTSESARVPGDPFSDLQPTSKSTFDHADDWAGRMDDTAWDFSAFLGGTNVNSSIPFPQSGSIYSSSVPSSSWSTQPSSVASSPESFPATAAICSLPSTQRSNLASSHYIDNTSGRGNQAYSSLPSPALLTDYLNESRMTSVEQTADGSSGTLSSSEPHRDVGHSNGTTPATQTRDGHPATPSKRQIKLEIPHTDTSPHQAAASTMQARNRLSGTDGPDSSTLTPAVPAFRPSSTRSCGQSQDRSSVTGAAGMGRSYTSTADRYTYQEPDRHDMSASSGVFEGRVMNQVSYQDIINSSSMSPRDRLISRHLGQYSPYSMSRPMSSGHTADRRPPYSTCRPARSHAGSVTSSGVSRVAHYPNGAMSASGMVQPTAQRRAAHFNVMAEMSPPSHASCLTSTPRSASARLESQVDGPVPQPAQTQEGPGSLRSVALSRKQAPPSPPFRPMYGQDVPCTTTKDRPKSGKNVHPPMQSQLGGADKNAHQKADSAQPPHGMIATNDNRDGLVGNNSLGLVLKNPLVGTNIVDLITKTEMSSVHRVQKRAIVACTPCRTTKRKCDGGQPCSACRRRKYPRGGPCEYITPTQRPKGTSSKATTAASKKAAAQAAAVAAAAARQTSTGSNPSQASPTNGSATLPCGSGSGPMAGRAVVRTTLRDTKYSTQQPLNAGTISAVASTASVRERQTGIEITQSASPVEAVSTMMGQAAQYASGVVGRAYAVYGNQRGPAAGLDLFPGVKVQSKARPGEIPSSDEVKASGTAMLS